MTKALRRFETATPQRLGRRVRAWAHHALFALLCVTQLVANAAAPTPSGDMIRVALVIGNSAYEGAPLLNPTNDARAMAKSLRSAGFSVIEVHDATRAQFEQAIVQAREMLQGRHGLGLLYFAGHGLQLDWHNYMVPVGARFSGAADVPSQAVDVSEVLDAFKAAGNRTNVIVLDACRDNPFESVGSGKGLAPVDAPSGTLIAYATAPGNVAEDGDVASGNGLYTQVLVQEMGDSNARIEDVFKRVRLHVRQLSRGRQIPWESTSLEEDLHLGAGTDSGTARADESRQKQFGDDMADWNRIRSANDPAEIQRFLNAHPSGPLVEVALARLDRLNNQLVAANSSREQPLRRPGAKRHYKGDAYVFRNLDYLTGKETARYTLRVTGIDGDLVEVNNGDLLMTESGRDIRIGNGHYDPPLITVPPVDFVVGDKWTQRTLFTPARGPRQWREFETSIVAYEDVTVPAGTFKAYRLETTMKGEFETGYKSIHWFEPEWGMSIRVERVGHSRYEGFASVRELVSRRRGDAGTTSVEANAKP